MTKGIVVPGPPADYQPKRGGAQQTWFPTVNVRVAMSPADAAYFKARMDEQLADREEDKK